MKDPGEVLPEESVAPGPGGEPRIRDRIIDLLAHRTRVDRRARRDGEIAAAAVILLLRPPSGHASPDGDTALHDHEVLFIERATAVEDPWSGHIAFPGGRREPGDPDLRRTALRELREETGLALAEEDLLGELDPVHPRSLHLPSIRVTPFVGWLGHSAEITGNVEITGHFWLSLRELLDPGRRSILRRRRGPALRVFPTIEHEGHTIWGLTYVILRSFLDLILADAPPPGQD